MGREDSITARERARWVVLAAVVLAVVGVWMWPSRKLGTTTSASPQANDAGLEPPRSAAARSIVPGSQTATEAAQVAHRTSSLRVLPDMYSADKNLTLILTSETSSVSTTANFVDGGWLFDELAAGGYLLSAPGYYVDSGGRVSYRVRVVLEQAARRSIVAHFLLAPYLFSGSVSCPEPFGADRILIFSTLQRHAVLGYGEPDEFGAFSFGPSFSPTLAVHFDSATCSACSICRSGEACRLVGRRKYTTLPVTGPSLDTALSGTLFPGDDDDLSLCHDFFRVELKPGARIAAVPRGLPEGHYRLVALAGSNRVQGMVERSPRQLRIDPVVSQGTGAIQVQVTGVLPRFDGTSWTPEFVTVTDDGLTLSQRPSAAGSVRFDGVPIGSYLVDADYGGCARSRSVVVVDQQVSYVEIRLSEEPPYFVPWLGAEFDPSARSKGQLVLRSLHLDGLLARLGARTGDEITSVNGLPAEHVAMRPSCIVGFSGSLTIGVGGRTLYWDDPTYAVRP